MGIVDFNVKLKPTNLFKTMQEHKDVSESSKANLIATKIILNKRVNFYSTGEHEILNSELKLEEQFNSEILRFTHASLITGQPEGDKAILWVDASVDPVNIWVYGQPVDQFLKQSILQIKGKK